MKEQLKLRTKEFAHNCIRETEVFPNTYIANHIKKQLIRSSTSVAANYRATCIAQSKPSFIAKISIEEILRESKELTSIFIASRKTASKK